MHKENISPRIYYVDCIGWKFKSEFEYFLYFCLLNTMKTYNIYTLYDPEAYRRLKENLRCYFASHNKSFRICNIAVIKMAWIGWNKLNKLDGDNRISRNIWVFYCITSGTHPEILRQVKMKNNFKTLPW